MDYGICLPNFPDGASREGMEAAAETAERLGWSTVWTTNVGVADRFHVRGRYTDETIRLWRHLWSGSTEPFHGDFHDFEDFAFAPLPDRGADLPIVVGGRAEAALRRAGTLGDGYHSSATSAAKYADRVPVIRAAAEAAGRPMPWLSARATTAFGPATNQYYAIRGTADEMAAEVRAFEALGVSHIALNFVVTDPAAVAALAERFAREVAPLV